MEHLWKIDMDTLVFPRDNTSLDQTPTIMVEMCLVEKVLSCMWIPMERNHM